MTTNRDFSTVLAAVIAAIPEDEPALRLALATTLTKASRIAPELHWQVCGPDVQYSLDLRKHLEDKDPSGWRGRVLAAWTGAA